MKEQMLLLIMAFCLCWIGCDRSSLEKMSAEQVNKIMSHVDENDAMFTQKDVSFDSILSYAGTRTLPSGTHQRVKLKLYYYGDRTRGYYNLADVDDKNLQVFGKKVDDWWALTCVTKLNMEEVGGYMIWKHPSKGVWSNGHHNFKNEEITLQKQNTDYNDLVSW